MNVGKFPAVCTAKFEDSRPKYKQFNEVVRAGWPFRKWEQLKGLCPVHNLFS